MKKQSGLQMFAFGVIIISGILGGIANYLAIRDRQRKI